MDRDRLGRRRHPEQGRGLRPLHPNLPPEWTSRAIRVAMSAEDWARFESLVAEASLRTPTQARASGEVIGRLLSDRTRPVPESTHWMDWERDKALRLLHKAN